MFGLTRQAIAAMSPKITPAPERVIIRTEVVRLAEEVYLDFAKKMPNTIINGTSTELQVAYQLGVQHVLNALKQDIVVKTSKA